MPSANGVALHVLAALARRTGEARFEEAALAQIAALAGTLTKAPADPATVLTAADRLRLGETGPRQYAGRGAAAVDVRVVQRGGDKARLELTLDIKKGWHINAHRPLQDYLIPTALEVAGPGWRLTATDYPAPEVVKLGFQRAALALYQGKTRIRAEIERTKGSRTRIPLELRLQACSDRVCLPPETLRLEVFLPR